MKIYKLSQEQFSEYPREKLEKLLSDTVNCSSTFLLPEWIDNWLKVFAQPIRIDWRHIVQECKKIKKNNLSLFNWFTSMSWLRIWWHFYGHKKEVAIFLIENDEGELLGFFPTITNCHHGFLCDLRVKQFIGTETSDHLDLALNTDFRTEVLSEVFNELANDPYWDVLDIFDIPSNSPNCELIKDIAKQKGFSIVTLERDICPYLTIPSTTWSEFFPQLRSKSTRKDIQRRLRRLRESGKVEFKKHTSTESIEKVFPQLKNVYAKRWKNKYLTMSFIHPREFNFYKNMSIDAATNNRLHLLTISLDDEIIAFSLGIMFKNQFTWLITSHDPDYGKYFIGEQLLIHLLEDLVNKQSIEEFDFTRGNEPYKFKWTKELRQNERILVFRNNFKGMMLKNTLQFYHGLKKIKNILKNRFHQGK